MSEGTDAADALFEDLLEQQRSRRLPPVDQWQPERTGQIDIRIDRDGRWFHEGGEIRRPAMVELFASILRRDAEGYVLVTPVERLIIEVEDAPFLAIGMEARGEGAGAELLFSTNVGDHVLLDAEHPLRTAVFDGVDVPYVLVRDDLWARLDRPVYYRLVEQAVRDDAGTFGVWSGGMFHPLEPRD